MLNHTVQYLEKYRGTVTTAGIQGLALTEQARGLTHWRREKRWPMAELKDRP